MTHDMTPQWIAYAFTGINVFIALSYVLLALFFARRLKLPTSCQTNPLTILACVCAMFFFVGCAHTHIDLAYWSATDSLRPHWYSWWSILSRVLQGVGGLTFWVLATFFLQVNIFDKRHYDQTMKNLEVPPQDVDRLVEDGGGSVDNPPEE